MDKIITIVGSRETPQKICQRISEIAEWFAERGWVLRSGGAEGADAAAERGWLDYSAKRDEKPSRMEIYIPWKYFNKNPSKLIGASPDAIQMASELHPAWDKCSEWAKVLHGRNCYQILGRDLKSPSTIVVYWAEVDNDGNVKGGTATAIKLAKQHNIPTYNLHYGDLKLNNDGTFEYVEKPSIDEASSLVLTEDGEDIPF